MDPLTRPLSAYAEGIIAVASKHVESAMRTGVEIGRDHERKAILAHLDWLLEPGRCSDEERRLVAGIAGWIRSERRD